MKITERGFYTLKWGENSKTMHFSRLFLNELNKETGMDIVSFGEKLQKAEDEQEQLDCVTHIAYAAFVAHDKMEGTDIDYNFYRVGNWVWDALNEDHTNISNMIGTMQDSLSGGKKQKGVK